MNTYKNTRHSKFLLNYHFVWIPKYRNSILSNTDIQHNLIDTINELSVKHSFDVLALEIMPDHIHLFISCIPKYSPSQLMNIIKGTTGRRLSKNFPHHIKDNAVWTRAYFVSTAGNVSTDTIKQYINNQRKE